VVSINRITYFLILLALLTSGTILGQEAGQSSPGGASGKAGKAIGADFGGGRIFWTDETGQHGLVASSTDQSAAGIAWNPGGPLVIGASADGCYAGKQNTEKIVSTLAGATQYAAKLCSDLVITVNNVRYDDWYLPSSFELNLLFRQKKVIGGFNETSGIYWSSTESPSTPGSSAWEQEFRYGNRYEDDKDMPNQVRCIRKF